MNLQINTYVNSQATNWGHFDPRSTCLNIHRWFIQTLTFFLTLTINLSLTNVNNDLEFLYQYGPLKKMGGIWNFSLN